MLPVYQSWFRRRKGVAKLSEESLIESVIWRGVMQMLCLETFPLLFVLKIRSPIRCEIRNNSQLKALNKKDQKGVQMQGRYLENFYNSYDQSMLDSLDKQESEWRGKEAGLGFASCPKWSEFTCCFGRFSPFETLVLLTNVDMLDSLEKGCTVAGYATFGPQQPCFAAERRRNCTTTLSLGIWLLQQLVLYNYIPAHISL